MGDEKFLSREEAIDFGKDYEYLMAAYYGLTLSFNDEISDFKMSTNNNELGDFDDVVIECGFKNGQEHVFALQLKHVVRPIAQITLITNNKKFSLKKYSKEFQKAKINCMKSSSYSAPFENFHFLLFSNSILEKFEDVSEDWQKLEPTADHKKVESDMFIRRSNNCVGKDLFSISQTNEDFLYEFKSEKEDSIDAEFFKQFSFYTKQKDAKEMEALIAEIILKKFKNCDPSVAINYLNYFNYWCRRDFGTFKLTKEDVRLKLAELILAPYIPEPDLEKMNYFTEDKTDLLYKLFLLFDVVQINEQSEDIINKIWNIVLKKFCALTKEWSTPLPGVYANLLTKNLEIPISAFNENFNEMSIKKMYILMWHTGSIPMVVKIDKNLPGQDDILLAIELSENKGNKKKFILIDEHSCFRPYSKWTVLKYLSDFSCFDGLYTTLIQKLLISLQGRSFINLQQLAEIDQDLIKCVTVKEVILMSEDNFLIGTDCKKNFPKFYVKRSVPKILLDIKAITELEKDLFVVSDATDDSVSTINSIDLDKYLLLKQFGSHKDYIPRQIKMSSLKKTEIGEKYGQKFFILAKNGCTKQQFREICSINEDKNCHHVRFIDEEKIEWIESRFSIKDIRKYRLDLGKIKPEEFVCDEDTLRYFNGTINVICGNPGMGKSIMMKFLMFKCPPDHWTVMVNLGEHVTFFTQTHNLEEILSHFLKMEYQTHLAEHLIRSLSSRKQVLFLWDGFDEIPEECVDHVITTIKNLVQHGFSQWVAARNNSKKYLEETFNTIALTLTEFSLQDQYNYVYSHLKDQYEDDEKVQETIDQVNKNITATLSCGYFDYTGIPLQLHMVVEIYLRKPKNTNFDLITLTDIYKEFIQGKFDNLFEKAEADSDNHYMQEIRQEYSNAQLVLYENAAMKASFDNKHLVNLNLDCQELFEELGEGSDNLGLIVSIKADKSPIFSHKTYEEFLAASWLAKNCYTHPELVKILFEERYSNVRLMLDMLLARDSPLHLAVLYRNLDMLKMHEEDIEGCKDKGGRNLLHVACSWGRQHPIVEIIGKDNEERAIRIKGDKHQASVNLINFIRHGNSTLSKVKEFESPVVLDTVDKIVTKLYQQEDDSVPSTNTIMIYTDTVINAEDEDSTYKEILMFLLNRKFDVFETDNLLKWNAFQYADQSFSLGTLNVMIQYHTININDLKNYNSIPTLLHYYVISFYDNLLKIIPHVPYIEYKYSFGRINLMQLASELNNLKAVEQLLKHQSYRQVINVQSAFSGNLLASAAFHGNLEMMDILIENGIQVNGHKTPPLYAATTSGKIESCQKLLKAGVDVNETSSDGNCALIMSIMLDEPEITNLLLEQGANINSVFNDLTALDYATKNLETVKLLLQYKPDLNRQCEKLGYTSLHIASETDELDILKCLLEHGADTKIKSKKGLTPLHVAVANGKEANAVELIRVDSSVVNEYTLSETNVRMSPIMLATAVDLPHLIRLLVQYGADVDAKQSDSSPLCYAASHNMDCCVEALIDSGASVNKPDKDGVTPLFRATNCLSTVKILLDHSADIKAKSNSGDTVLHFAAHGDNLDVMKELITRGADVNTRNNQNWTPVYVSIANKQLEMTKFLLSEDISFEDGGNLLGLAARGDFPEVIPFLLKKGIDVNLKDEHGLTPLTWASLYGNSCVQVLVDNGADPNMGGGFNIPPLLLSLVLGQTNIVSQLLSAGAHMKDFETPSALHIAVGSGDIFNTVLLTGNGADVNAVDNQGETPLHYACSGDETFASRLENVSDSEFNVCVNYNKDDCARELITKGANVNQRNHKDVTPLHVACQKRCLKIVKLLVQNGADVNALDNEGRSPLHMCYVTAKLEPRNPSISEGKSQIQDATDIVRILADGSAKLDIQDGRGWTALFYACSCGDLASVKFLHEMGSNLFVEDNNGGSLLTEASQHTKIIKYLVEKGLNVNHKNNNGITPLYKTCIDNNYEGTGYLLSKGADINAYTNEEHLTVIHVAVLKGHLEIVKLLLQYNADISKTHVSGNTVIYNAAGYNHLDIIKIFAKNFGIEPNKNIQHEFGSEIDFKEEWKKSFNVCASKGHIEVLKYVHECGLVKVNDKIEVNGLTALHNASYFGQHHVAKYLIENGADIDAKDCNGCTPLHYASETGQLEIIKLLIGHNAQVDIPKIHGNTALFVAAAYGFLDVVELLHESGAAVNVVDADGDIPLHDAACRGHLSIVKFLVLQKAEVNHMNKNGKTPLDLASEQNHQDIVDFLRSNEYVEPQLSISM